MKVGDTVPVIIGGSQVATAEVKELGDGTATLIVPATRVVMAVRTELAPEVTPVTEQSTQTIVDEVVRTVPEPSDTTAQPQANAGGEVTQSTNDDAAKVITSSSVPSEGDAATDRAKFDALDPSVQAKIMEVVNAHNAAQAQAAQDAAPE